MDRQNEQANIFVPTVIERTGRGERAYDIYSRLLDDRIVFVGTPINDTVAKAVNEICEILKRNGE